MAKIPLSYDMPQEKIWPSVELHVRGWVEQQSEDAKDHLVRPDYHRKRTLYVTTCHVRILLANEKNLEMEDEIDKIN